MANGFGGGFGGNMGGFTLPDFSQIDLSGIGAAVAKYEADEARKRATNQYEADVAEFKTNEANELEQGLGSLEQSPAEEIVRYLGTDEGDSGVYNEQYDTNNDGVVDLLDAMAAQQQFEQQQIDTRVQPLDENEFFLPEDGRGEPIENDIDIRDSVGTGTVVEDLYETDPYVNPIPPDALYTPPPPDLEPQVIDEIAQTEVVDQSTPVFDLPGEPPERDIDILDPVGTGSVTNPYDEVFDTVDFTDTEIFEPRDPDINKNWWELFGYESEQAAIDSGDYTYDEELDMWLPNDPVVIPEPEDEEEEYIPPIMVDPNDEEPPIVIDDPEEPPEEYVPEEEMYTPPVTITNPAQENLINQQRQTYNSNLSNLVYRAPDIEIDEYVRPMSAAQFGSVPGSAEDVRTPVYKPETEDAIDTDMGFIAMNQGGSLNLNNSSMNRGIGQLPPMQQQDKLTQLFQSSFRPRR
jgi:hypothetical protein